MFANVQSSFRQRQPKGRGASIDLGSLGQQQRPKGILKPASLPGSAADAEEAARRRRPAAAASGSGAAAPEASRDGGGTGDSSNVVSPSTQQRRSQLTRVSTPGVLLVNTSYSSPLPAAVTSPTGISPSEAAAAPGAAAATAPLPAPRSQAGGRREQQGADDWHSAAEAPSPDEFLLLDALEGFYGPTSPQQQQPEQPAAPRRSAMKGGASSGGGAAEAETQQQRQQQEEKQQGRSAQQLAEQPWRPHQPPAPPVPPQRQQVASALVPAEQQRQQHKGADDWDLDDIEAELMELSASMPRIQPRPSSARPQGIL